MRVREQTGRDDDAVAEVLAQAFGDGDRVPRLAADLRARTDPGVALVAVDEDDTVIGQVQLSTSWVDAEREVVEVLVLSPLGVRPDHQRRGVGKALLAAAIEAAERAGAPVVFLEGDPRYYGPKGWLRADEHGFTKPSVRVPDVGFQVRLLPGHEPWMTGALVYNDTFWVHDCVGLRADAPSAT